MRRLLYVIIHIIARPLFKILFGFKVKGRENIPSRGGVIVASNHLSFLDPPLVGVALPRVAHYMARDDLFAFPIWGSFLRSVNAFPVRRQGVDRGAIKKAIEYLKGGKLIILFPEGTRSLTGEFLEPMPGVGMIAWEGKATIVPAYIKGSNRALPPQAKFIKFKKIEVIFGEPFSPEKLFSSGSSRGEISPREIYSNISRYIMAEISKLKETS